jgi:hypothetical protein
MAHEHPVPRRLLKDGMTIHLQMISEGEHWEQESLGLLLKPDISLNLCQNLTQRLQRQDHCQLHIALRLRRVARLQEEDCSTESLGLKPMVHEEPVPRRLLKDGVTINFQMISEGEHWEQESLGLLLKPDISLNLCQNLTQRLHHRHRHHHRHQH